LLKLSQEVKEDLLVEEKAQVEGCALRADVERLAALQRGYIHRE